MRSRPLTPIGGGTASRRVVRLVALIMPEPSASSNSQVSRKAWEGARHMVDDGSRDKGMSPGAWMELVGQSINVSQG